jgi:hypothetical protein
MVYVHWELLGFLTFSIVRYSKKQNVSEHRRFRPQVRGDTTTLLSPIEKANLNRSKGPNTLVCYLLTWACKQVHFPKRCIL